MTGQTLASRLWAPPALSATFVWHTQLSQRQLEPAHANLKGMVRQTGACKVPSEGNKNKAEEKSLAKPGMIKARSRSERLLRRLSSGTPQVPPETYACLHNQRCVLAVLDAVSFKIHMGPPVLKQAACCM